MWKIRSSSIISDNFFVGDLVRLSRGSITEPCCCGVRAQQFSFFLVFFLPTQRIWWNWPKKRKIKGRNRIWDGQEAKQKSNTKKIHQAKRLMVEWIKKTEKEMERRKKGNCEYVCVHHQMSILSPESVPDFLGFSPVNPHSSITNAALECLEVATDVPYNSPFPPLVLCVLPVKWWVYISQLRLSLSVNMILRVSFL